MLFSQWCWSCGDMHSFIIVYPTGQSCLIYMKFRWATDGYWCYCIASWYGGCISGTSLPCWSHGVLQEPEERPSESWTAFSKRSWWIWWWWSRSAVSGTRASPSCKLSSWGLGAPRWSRCTEAYESSDFKSLLGSWNWSLREAEDLIWKRYLGIIGVRCHRLLSGWVHE